MKREYCTYFDHRYAARGIAMVRSLRRHSPHARVWVLCMDPQTEQLFSRISEPGVVPLSLREFEAGDTPLQEAKRDGRSLIEYYFTCTASLMRYVMRQVPDAEFVTYLDGDLWFFADPEPVYDEMGRASTLIIPHRYPPGFEANNRYGVHNVGWVTFRNSPDGIACLEWWRDRTLEWCFDIVDERNDRFADQRYLDSFSRHFAGVHSLLHPGANFAPWNVATHTTTCSDGHVSVDGRPLLFFHFHGLKRAGKRLFLTSHGLYGGTVSGAMRECIYRPYLNEFLAVERQIKPHVPHAQDEQIRIGAPRAGTLLSRLRTLRGYLRSAYALSRGLTIWVKDVQES